jgi:hypothetical protein
MLTLRMHGSRGGLIYLTRSAAGGWGRGGGVWFVFVRFSSNQELPGSAALACCHLRRSLIDISRTAGCVGVAECLPYAAHNPSLRPSVHGPGPGAHAPGCCSCSYPDCTFGRWPMTGAGSFREGSAAGRLPVADLFRDKNTAGWWLINQKRTGRMDHRRSFGVTTWPSRSVLPSRHILSSRSP